MAKKRLYILLIILISLPGLQYFSSLVKVKPLKGWFAQPSNPTLSLDNWFNGSFQENKETYLKDKFGFRPHFVQINNQIDYSLFNKLHANSVIVGKEEYLFEHNYIKAYYGTDFVGDSVITDKMEKLDTIQAYLNKLGKKICIVLAPGKASFFPEYIPDAYKQDQVGKTNYAGYLSSLKESNIPYIDFQNWFLEQKESSSYPLYAKGGIHWSRYGEVIAADSIITYIGELTHKNVPDLVIDNIEMSNKNKFTDYDIGEALNLLVNQGTSTYPMAYPNYHIKTDSNTENVKTLFVSDSFYWGMFNSGFASSLFGQGKFWFYNEQIYPDSYEASINVSEVDIIKRVEEHDVIVLMSTDANLYKFAYGFIDQLYDAYIHQDSTSSL